MCDASNYILRILDSSKYCLCVQAKCDNEVLDTTDESEFEEFPATWGFKWQDASHDEDIAQATDPPTSPIPTRACNVDTETSSDAAIEPDGDTPHA